MMILFVAFGGALGAVMRYLTLVSVSFPYGTMMVNVAGSFLMGLAYVFVAARGGWPVFVMTGVLGGFTTFSAFSLDTLRLVEAGRVAMAGGYVFGSVALSVAAVFAGVLVARGLTV
jgi:CrcB protein